MPDVWATVSQLDAATQERLAEVLETRGADPQQQAMRRAFLAEIARELAVGLPNGGCPAWSVVRPGAGELPQRRVRGDRGWLHAQHRRPRRRHAPRGRAARRRRGSRAEDRGAAAGTFFGHIAYASLTARKPS